MDSNKKEVKREVKMGKIIKIDQGEIKLHLEKLVMKSVEETLNAFLDAEADQLCKATRYERTPERIDTRAGHYTRKYHSKAGEVNLKIPKLRKFIFETSIIERYRRRESSIEEALVEMYLAGVSVRRVKDITQALWGTQVSSGTISNMNKKVYERIEEWRNAPITGNYSYVYMDGTYLKRSWGGEVKNVSILVAFGVNEDGYREVLGISEGAREDYGSWLSFLRLLIKRGLTGVRLIVSDKNLGLVEAIGECFPQALWQRCTVHFYRNVFTVTPSSKVSKVKAMLKAIHAQEDRDAAKEKIELVVKKLEKMKLPEAAKIVKNGAIETLTYYSFPREHWRFIKTNNPMERIIKEIKRRTRVVGSFPDGKSALMLAAARVRYMADNRWGTRRYMNMNKLKEMDKDKAVIIG